MSSCQDILKRIKASPEEISYIDKHIKGGLETGTITEKVIKEIDNQRFRKASNNLSEIHTKSYIEKLIQVVEKNKKPYKSLFNFLVGDKSGITSRSLARSQARFGYLSAKLKMPNRDIKAKLNDQGFVRDLIHEMDEFTTKPKTKNKLAHELADALTQYQKKQLKEVNSFGGGVFWRDDYITKQWHDSARMIKDGGVNGEKWVNNIYKHLDHEETKERIRNIILDKKLEWDESKYDLKKYLKSAWVGATSKSSNSGLILDSLHMKRTLKFKDTDSFMAYNKMYGHENIGHAIMENMSMMDNHISFGEAFGFGYREKVKLDDVTLDSYKDALREAKFSKDKVLIAEAEDNLFKAQNKEINPIDQTKRAIYLLKEQGKITKPQFRRLRGALSQVTGASYELGNPMWSKMVTGFQFWEYVTKLGKATLSSVNDLWTGAVVLHYQGVKPGKAYLGIINHILKKATQSVSEGERDILLRQLNVGVDGIFESYSRNYINNPAMGKLNKMTDTMFDLNLLNWWTNSSREGAAKMMSMHVADNIGKSFNKLPPRFKTLLEGYGITARDWKILDKVGSFDETLWNPKGSKKNKFFTTDHFIDVISEPLENGDFKIKPEFENIVSQADAERIRQSFNRYFIMESRVAVPEAGAADRVWMFGEHARGSLPENTARLFFQFRTHQVKMIRSLAPRMYEMGTPSLMHVLPAIGLGYVSASLKNLVAGKEPLPYDDPQTLKTSLEQSGILGFIADFLGGQFGNYKQDLDEAILGSGYKTITSWSNMGYELAKGNKDAIDVYNHLRHQIPFANLFWTEAAVNYGLHYGIMETFKPGYLKRLEARQSGTGSDFIVNPSSVWSYGGLR